MKSSDVGHLGMPNKSFAVLVSSEKVKVLTKVANIYGENASSTRESTKKEKGNSS